ncbi:type II toxin-antitoxin system PemK/MazF family toxin [Psychroflexus aestuariivivens]|uniref:type II toxin-antitoxin system PemK/MazF family toxin n=1 Tax=Psychroflexus aestuariivivens TaxID=1795040 RepID=UPI001F032829|nr:type II toxin-antitoxin system PemK/MazF family toxin [Psychroflexus aestuariivivens]
MNKVKCKTNSINILQGEIWQVYLDPIKGSEQGGNRPLVVISGNTLNKNLGVVIGCPLSTSIHDFEGNLILNPTESNGLIAKSEVMVFHVRSLSKERFKKKLGNISFSDLDHLKKTLNDILKY